MILQEMQPKITLEPSSQDEDPVMAEPSCQDEDLVMADPSCQDEEADDFQSSQVLYPWDIDFVVQALIICVKMWRTKF